MLVPATAAAGAKVGASAPNFTLVTFDGQKFSLADLKGEVVVLNYWATWCAPCKREMVVLENYIRRHRGTDLKIFAVNVERSVPDYKLKPLAKILSFPLIHTLNGSGYGLVGGGVPTSYVIDRGGIVRHAAAGAFDDDSFDALVTPLLAVAAPQGGDVRT
jgi:thiol-disulfide isomerase/thioredoxin